MTNFAILYGKDDLAGQNIIENIKSNHFLPQTPIIETKKHPIYLTEQDIKKYPELKTIDFIVFATKHQSEKQQHSLSLHAPGNPRNADYGGDSGKLSTTSALILKYLFQELNKNAQPLKEKYEITLECTHHGPSINIPCCFIEIGSSEEQWKDKQAGKIIAKTIASLQDYKSDENWIPAIGIGGPHYCPSFNKIQQNSKYAVSHILPSYQKPINQSMIQEAEQKTKEQIKEILIEWKSFNGQERQELIKIIEKIGLKLIKSSDIKK